MSDQQSVNTPEISSRRRMQVVAERVLPDPAVEPAAPTTTAPTTTSSISLQTTTSELVGRQAWRQGVLGALTVAIRILAARAILLFSVLGAIALACIALSDPDYIRLGVLALYTLTVTCPLVWLAGRQ